MNLRAASTTILSATTLCLTGDVCRTTWPGGYCSSSCFLSGACGDLLAPGTCTPQGQCLQRCSAAGAGQSDCRTDYVCALSDGTGSQGVCVPKCQAVPCASGHTCQASGYCS